MERHKALAAAATVTVLTATGTVALAATGHSGLLGFGSPFGLQRASADSASATRPYNGAPPTTAATQVVTQLQDVYDRFVVTVPDPSASAPAAGPASGDASNDAAPPDVATTTPVTTEPPESNEPPPSTTSTARPQDDGEYQPSQPPPPVPPGCKDPQLEDNGVWNCQH